MAVDCSRRRARSPASPVVDGRASDGQDRCGFCAPARCGSVAGCRFELVVKRCATSTMFTLRHVPMGERGALDAFTPSAWAFDGRTAARREVTNLDRRRAQAGCHVPMASSAPCREPSRPASRGRSVYDRPVQNARPEHRDISGEGVPDRAIGTVSLVWLGGRERGAPLAVGGGREQVPGGRGRLAGWRARRLAP